MRRLFLLFVAFFATYYLWAQDVIFKSGDLYYTIRQMTYAPWEIAEVCALPNPDGYNYYYTSYPDLTEAIIPETVEYEGRPYPVTSIGFGAFKNSTNLKSVSIPNSVTMIWDDAFNQCNALTEINIPNSVEIIGNRAFHYCQSLESLEIPEGVWQIGDEAFMGNFKLTNLKLPNSLQTIGKSALSGCGFKTITIPTGLNTLPMGLFGICMELESLVIPNNITTIESDVFVGCLGLTSIEIPNSVESLGGYAFSGCDNLETVILSEKLTVIEDGTFTNCPNIKNIYFNSTTPPSIGGSSTIDSSTPTCYIPCGTLEAYEASDWAKVASELKELCNNTIIYTSLNGKIVTPYAKDAFGANIISNTYENGLGIITFDGPITSIGDFAFYECSQLWTITLPESVTSIGNSAFDQCVMLSSINLPESITSIGSQAFFYCIALNEITIPMNVTSIEWGTFNQCSSLKSITIHENITSIGNQAFDRCYNLETIYVNAMVPPTLGGSVFYNTSPICYIPCGKIEAYQSSDWIYTSVILEEQCSFQIQYTSSNDKVVEPYNLNAFGANIVSNVYKNGQGLITLDGPVTKIGAEAFSGCQTLTSIVIPKDVKDIEYYAFARCESLTSIVVVEENTKYDSRDNCNAIIETATNSLIVGCKNTVIPNSVTSIGDFAFYAYQTLTSITLPNSITSIGVEAFSGCNLIDLTIPGSVKSIGMWAFIHCSSLSNLTLQNGIETIGERAFAYCSALKSIILPESVTKIDIWAFRDCALDEIHVNATIPPTIIEQLFQTPPTCYIPCGTLEAYEASDWAKQVGEFVEECEAEQYTRDVTPNRYGTICLPFGSTDFSGATFYEIAYKAPFMIYFDEVTKLEAGKPYIFYAHSNKLIVTSDGSRVNNPLFDNGLYGTFDEIVAAAINILTNNYIVNNNTLCLCGEYCSLSANRAYVKLDEVSSTARALSPGRKRVSMSVQGENTTTALDNISEETESITIKEGVYDILGRKMSQPVGMGFYIIDGQKVIISQ